MPAVSRRTTRNRARSPSEEIEDQPDTQETHTDDVVESNEEEVPTARPTKKGSKSKTKTNGKVSRTGSRRTRHNKNGDEGPGVPAQQEAEEPIDVENFKDQPLGTEDAMKIRGLVMDWTTITQKIEDNPFTLVRDIGASMAEVASGEDGEAVSRIHIFGSFPALHIQAYNFLGRK